MKALILYCARLMPNILMAVTAVVLFMLLGITILISILFEDWYEARPREDSLSIWEHSEPQMLHGESALQPARISSAASER